MILSYATPFISYQGITVSLTNEAIIFSLKSPKAGRISLEKSKPFIRKIIFGPLIETEFRVI